MSSSKDKYELTLFKSEYEVYEKSQKILQGPSLTKEELLEEYQSMSHKYKNLLNHFVKVTKISDSLQSKILYEKMFSQSIIENANFGLIVLNPDAKIERLNPAIRKIFDSRVYAFDSNRVIFSYPLFQSDQIRRRIQNGFKGQKDILSHEKVVMERQIKYVDIHFIPIQSDPGEYNLLIFIVDISDIVKVKNELERQHAKILFDLELGRKVQETLQPKKIASHAKYKVDFRYIPSRNLSGDIYDAFKIDEHRLGLYIADISGHGLASAMIGIFVRNLIETIQNDLYYQKKIINPQLVLEYLNQRMMNTMFQNDEYLTLFYGIFDSREYEFVYSCAAHSYVYLIRDQQVQKIGYPSLAIGWSETAEFGLKRIQLMPEDKLIFITDGILETRNGNNELYGEKRLISFIEQFHAKGDHIPEAILEDLRLFKVSDTQEDDISILYFELL